MEIKRVKMEDVKQLSELSKLTFKQTFAKVNTQEDIQNYLNDNLSVEQLSREVNNSCSEFYFIQDENETYGFIKLNTNDAQSEKMADSWLELERIYMTKAAQGKGLGQKLLDFTIARATELGKKTVWLGVWEENKLAINFYEKNRFSPFSEHIFKLGADEQKDILYKLGLGE